MPAAEPLAGRQLYFVGIGGSGLSAYANIARAWGAEVRGWDVRETIFMQTLDGIEVDLGGEPRPPAGWEVVVSTAHAQRVAGRPRAELPRRARRPARRRSSSAARTARRRPPAMIACVLRETGHDPSWIVGGVVPQLGGNAGVGSGWLVVEGDESDRSIFALRPQIASSRTSSSTTTPPTRPRPSSGDFFDDWLAGVPQVVRGWELEPVELALAIPGEHNRQNAAAALAVARARRRRRAPRRSRRSRAFTGVGRRFELVGERGGVRVYDDYGHNPTELEVTLRTARERRRADG